MRRSNYVVSFLLPSSMFSSSQHEFYVFSSLIKKKGERSVVGEKEGNVRGPYVQKSFIFWAFFLLGYHQASNELTNNNRRAHQWAITGNELPGCCWLWLLLVCIFHPIDTKFLFLLSSRSLGLVWLGAFFSTSARHPPGGPQRAIGLI